MFRAKYAPNYRIPFVVCMSFQAFCFFLALFTWWVTKDLERETRRVAAERKRVAKEEGRVSDKQVVLDH